MKIGEIEEVFKTCKSPNWDGYGAKPVTLDNFLAAVRFFETIPTELHPNGVAAEPDGEIDFDWFKKSPHIDFSISVGINKFTFAGIGGKRNQIKSHGIVESPEEALSHLKKFIDKVKKAKN